MSDKLTSGKISFIHHEKNRAVIEYEENGKKRTIQANLNEQVSSSSAKPHRFLIGDQVVFRLRKTGGNGRIQYASDVQYQYNTGLEIILQKAMIQNKFLGYIKLTDGQYFVKEIESYLFFPLKISPYEIAPNPVEFEKAVIFKLDNFEKPDKVYASLYNHEYLPEFQAAVQHFKKQTPIEATVTKVTPYGVYVNLVGDKINGKLAIDDQLTKMISDNKIQPGTVLTVKIKHLSPEKLVIERADN